MASGFVAILHGVLLLVTGASGVGKTTVRRLLDSQLRPEVECVELSGISADSAVRDLAWRHRAADLAIRHAVQLQRDGRHLLLCGDPVAVVEVAAAPAAPELDGLAACLLDADAETQAARLATRGDPSELVVHHQAFADWMRHQAADPLYMLEVVSTGGWEKMRWERLPALAPGWHVEIIDTTGQTPPQVAAAVLSWTRAALAGDIPVIHSPL